MKKLIALLFLSLQISAQTFNPYSATLTGFSALPTDTARYSLNGNLCTVFYNQSTDGTSNVSATSKTVTLPYTAAISGVLTMTRALNSGSWGVGIVFTTAGSNIAKVFYNQTTNSNWSSSGAARFQLGVFTYEVKKPSEHTVFFMGNSLMNYGANNLAYGMRMPLTCYSSIISDSICAMQNYSVGGKTTTQMLVEFGTVLKPYLKNGDVVFIWEGANDLGSVDSTTAYNNLVAYCDSVHAYGGVAIIGTLIPSTNGNEANKLAVNRNILLNYAAFADTVCDFRTLPEFNTVSDAGNTTYYNADGTHQTNAGSDILGNFASPEIKYFLRQ